MSVSNEKLLGDVDLLRRLGWLHFYQMDAVGSGSFEPSILVGGRGIYVQDLSGREYIDAISGAYCVNIGYGRHEVLDAAYTAASQLHFVSPFTAGNRPAVALAAKLSKLAEPVLGPSARVFLVNSGSEAVETAMKVARAVARRRGRGSTIVSKQEAYHGTTFGALSVSGFPELQQEFGPLLPGVLHIPSAKHRTCCCEQRTVECDLSCAGELEASLLDPSRPVAAVLLEPFETSSGMVSLPSGYLREVSRAVRGAGALLMVDEVITGFGRMCHWFGAEALGVQADVIICSKGLTSGYDSLGAVIVRREVADVFSGNDDAMFAHGSTLGGRPGAAAAALKVIDIIEREGLLSHAAHLSEWLRSDLLDVLGGVRLVRSIRTEGLLAGIELEECLVGESNGPHTTMDRIQAEIRQNGVICSLYYTRTQPVIEIAPPLITTRVQCRQIVEKVAAALPVASNR